MKLARIFLVDIKQLLKDKMFYVKLIVLPMLIIFILGTVFKNNAKIAVFNVAFFNEDAAQAGTAAPLGSVLEKDVFESDDARSVINLIDVSSDEQGKKMLAENKAAAYIHIPSGFTQAYSSDERAGIDVYDGNATSLQKSVINSVLKRFVQNTDITAEIERAAVSVMNTDGVSPQILRGATEHLAASGNTAADIPILPAGSGTKPISVMQFLSVGMMLMFSILMGFVVVHNIVDEKLNRTYFRIGTTPTRKIEYISGRTLSIALSMVLQMVVIIALTTFLYGMNWGNTGLVLLTTSIYALAVGSLVVVTGLASKDQMTVSSLSTPTIFVLSFIGGSFVSADQFTGPFAFLHRIIPNGAANDAFLSIAEGKGFESIWPRLIKMAGFAVLFIFISVVMQKTEGGIAHANAGNGKKSTKAAA